jgi:PilZ domain
MVQHVMRQRKTFRRPARRAATVSFESRDALVSCVIWDISDDGARLAVAYELAKIPPRFTLNLSSDGSMRRDCEVVWRDGRFVGVKFTSQMSRPFDSAYAKLKS